MTTAFGLLSPSLEEDLGFSPQQLALVASFGNLGTFSGFISGLIIDYTTVRKAVFIGSTFIWFGLFFIWLSVTKQIGSNVGLLCIYIYMSQLGAATMSQASSSTAMLIFPSESHGQVASIAKAYYGVAGAVLSSIAATYFVDQDKGFVLFVSLFIPICNCIGGALMNLLPEDQISYATQKANKIPTTLSPYYKHFLALLVLIMITAALYLTKNSGGPPVHQLFGTIVVLWLCLVLGIRFVFYRPGADDVHVDNERSTKESVSIYDEAIIAEEIKARHSRGKSKSADSSDVSKHLRATDVELTDKNAMQRSLVSNSPLSDGSVSPIEANYVNIYGKDLNVSILNFAPYCRFLHFFIVVVGNASNG
jgi:hypothetical protein